MDIRSSLDGLKGLLGVTSASPSASQRVKAGPAAEGSFHSERSRHPEQRG
jgi:hypothetical protein